MINTRCTKYLFLCLILLGLVFLGGARNAQAVGAAYFPQDTTVNLSAAGGADYTILGGSDADSVVFNTTNIAITTSSGKSLTLRSASKYQLNNDGGLGSTCVGTTTQLVVTSATSKTITVTPNTAVVLCGSSSGGSGGSSGGGGGSPPVSTPVPTVSPVPSASVTPVPTYTPLPTASSTPALVLHKLLRTSRGSKIYAQGTDGNWYWIRTLAEFNAGGYRWSDVKVVSATAFAKLPVQSKITVKKGNKWVNVRVSPSLRGKIIDKFLPGNEFEKIDYNRGWYKIGLSDGRIGWVSGTVVNEN